MANYNVTRKTYRGDPETVLDDLETYIETIDDTKTLHVISILGDSQYLYATVIHDT